MVGVITKPKDTDKTITVKKLLAPIKPVAILCIGLNFHQHAAETGLKPPKYPVLFMKNPASINNPGDPVVIPKSCFNPPEVDYEAELAVIIGKTAKNISAEQALNYVFGYTIANDISARRWQKKAGGMQWTRSKSFDTFCPLGPTIITADEIPNPQNLQIKCNLNDKVMQDAVTSDMIFSVAEIIEYLSEETTLLPGTLILTGTPSGVGFARNPPVYLKPGDKVEITIKGIGSLVNPVVASNSLAIQGTK
ncbi:MAG: fumarylacetoacetate hydrolase family protein [Deltaproteobacteria bacterium]|nr:fumarylacetoacetate hydrolase family protein [Deltaproteobacteria bacterium]